MTRGDNVGDRRELVLPAEPRIQVDARRSNPATGQAELTQASVELEPLASQPLPGAALQPVSSSLLIPTCGVAVVLGAARASRRTTAVEARTQRCSRGHGSRLPSVDEPALDAQPLQLHVVEAVGREERAVRADNGVVAP